jgi:hypothetical protein
VAEKLNPLQALLDLDAAELKKVVLRLPAVLSLNHDGLAGGETRPVQARLVLNAAELKKVELRHPAVMGYNHDSLVAKLWGCSRSSWS